MVEYALLIGRLAIIVMAGVYAFGPDVVELYNSREVQEQQGTPAVSAVLYQ